MHAWQLRYSLPGHSCSSISCARSCPWRPHKPHRSIQLWSACPELSAGWSAGHLHDHARLASGPAGRSNPQFGHYQTTDYRMEPWGDNSPNRPIHLNSISSHANEPTSNYERVSYIGEPDPWNARGPSFSWFCQLYRVHSKGMPWWGWPSRLECMLDLICDQFYRPHMAAQVKEYTGKCCQCLTFRAKQPKALLENTSLTACPPWLPVSGAWERSTGECSSGNRPLHSVHPSLCYPIPDHTDNCQSLKRSFCIRVGITSVSWWLISVSWWGPKVAN